VESGWAEFEIGLVYFGPFFNFKELVVLSLLSAPGCDFDSHLVILNCGGRTTSSIAGLGGLPNSQSSRFRRRLEVVDTGPFFLCTPRSF